MICQAKGSTLLPITSLADPGKDFPESTSILFQYLHIALKWTLNASDPRKQKEGEEKRGPDMVYGTILLEGSCDIKDTIESVYLDMKKVGIIPQWKNVQDKVSDACLAIYGVPPEFCGSGIKSQLMHGMAEDEKGCAIRASRISNILERRCRILMYSLNINVMADSRWMRIKN